MANVRDPSGRLFSNVAATIPRPSDPALAASWDTVAGWCEPAPPVVRYIGPAGYSSLTDPPTLAPITPAITSAGSSFVGHPIPSVDLLRETVNGAVTAWTRRVSEGHVTRAHVYDGDATALRFVLAGNPSEVLASCTAEVAAENTLDAIPPGYIPAPPAAPPGDVYFGREESGADVPLGRLATRFMLSIATRSRAATFGLWGRVRAPMYDASARAWRDVYLPSWEAVAPDSEALPLDGAAPGDRVLFAVTGDAFTPGAWWRCGVVE